MSKHLSSLKYVEVDYVVAGKIKKAYKLAAEFYNLFDRKETTIEISKSYLFGSITIIDTKANFEYLKKYEEFKVCGMKMFYVYSTFNDDHNIDSTKNFDYLEELYNLTLGEPTKLYLNSKLSRVLQQIKDNEL
jgi:hypothetical protein